MKNYFKIIILLLIIPFLSACGSSGYGITYNTSPQGASVICNGEHKGYTPVELYYEFDMEKRYGYSEPCYTQWSSTGKKHYSTTWDLKKFPNGVIQTLDIPISANSSYSSSNSSSSSYGKANKQIDSSYNSVTPSFNSNSNSNSSSGFTTTFGNTYQYDLSNPVDRVKYNSDPRAKLRDRTSNQYMRELESIINQSGGGIIKKNNSPSWNNNMWNNNSWNNNSWNNNAPTWDWVN
jgi:hypothetical protein